jgi:hypothetical protein
MAWLIGLATDAEIMLLRKRGWEVEEAPAAVRSLYALPDPDRPDASLGESVDPATGSRIVTRAVQVYVDNDLFNIMSGPDWNTLPDRLSHTGQIEEYLRNTQTSDDQEADNDSTPDHVTGG